jgi:hypothetical protein
MLNAESRFVTVPDGVSADRNKKRIKIEQVKTQNIILWHMHLFSQDKVLN